MTAEIIRGPWSMAQADGAALARVCALLGTCSQQLASGEREGARLQLAAATLAMLGPGWELRYTGDRAPLS